MCWYAGRFRKVLVVYFYSRIDFFNTISLASIRPRSGAAFVVYLSTAYTT